ncbi:TonB-dependent receptor [Prolixibacter sp. NT017]|uniref:TonB-dependent receptor n=1 Tax=Prolixibacter sp. NT017 TaxID=2652390 RepID=UPI00126BFCB7|nr:TonB-dependent receptor [Prolixibacter sp. NT017]GET26415.1 TonB-dependent receptor [Prolixibacter sp. NT017]
MKKIQLIFLFALLSVTTFGQISIHGKLVDTQNQPLPGANIYFENTYEGTTSDSDGVFQLTSELTGAQRLKVTFLGYIPYTVAIPAKADTALVIKLQPENNKVDEVVITAGTFGTADDEQTVTLKAIDILTTPTSEGDVYGALRTLPGTQQVAEDGRLFVRGGEAYETKTFIDGMEMQQPYSSSTPDLPSRGRFSPELFKGTLFSTGGYSAEYGQALSSALILRTIDLPEESFTSIGLLNVGFQGGYTKRFERASISASGEYYNLGLNNKINPPRKAFAEDPVQMNGLIHAQVKSGKQGMWKTLYSFNHHKLIAPYATSSTNWENVALNSSNQYVNSTYRNMLSDTWMVYGGISGDYYDDHIKMEEGSYHILDRYSQGRAGLKYLPSEKVKINMGLDANWHDNERSNENVAGQKAGFTQRTLATYAEGEFQLGDNWAVRLGVRPEYFDLLQKVKVAPRLSLARKTGEHSQLSLAYGTFYQNAPDEFLAFNHQLKAEEAKHFILNYQYSYDKRDFRIETYYKDYQNLVKFNQASTEYAPSYYTSSGTGYSKGVDLFFRDRRSIPLLDYWIAYSYLDTKRDYRDFPEKATPGFVAKNTLSIVGKYWIAGWNTQFGFSLTAASGRPYDDPNTPEFMDRKAPAYSNFSLNAAHLAYLFGNYTIFYCSVGNVLGRDKPYTYRYSDKPNRSGVYERIPVQAETLRSIILGVFIQIK